MREGGRIGAWVCEAGLDVLELGVPFSDPTADGPEIQAATVRARAAGAAPLVLEPGQQILWLNNDWKYIEAGRGAPGVIDNEGAPSWATEVCATLRKLPGVTFCGRSLAVRSKS